jgi:hypothetical protein
MGLPVLELPIHIIELPVSKKQIQYKPFVIKEEKSLLTSINTDNQEDIVKLFEILVKNCVVGDDIDIDKLNIVDFFYLIIHIRMKSTSEVLDGKLECEHCKKQTEFEVNLEESLVIHNPENTSATIEINDKLGIEVAPPRIEGFFQQEEATIMDVIANSINTIIYDNKVYNDFTMEELHTSILHNLTKKDFDKIAEGINTLAKLTTEFKYVCMNCAKTGEYKTDNIVNFF